MTLKSTPVPETMIQPGPIGNVQSWIATSDLPIGTSGEALVLPFQDREQHDGSADVGEDEEDLQQRAQGPRVAAPAPMT
jgi:hypothetical protein